jgi:hypothetical protein
MFRRRMLRPPPEKGRLTGSQIAKERGTVQRIKTISWRLDGRVRPCRRSTFSDSLLVFFRSQLLLSFTLTDRLLHARILPVPLDLTVLSPLNPDDVLVRSDSSFSGFDEYEFLKDHLL